MRRTESEYQQLPWFTTITEARNVLFDMPLSITLKDLSYQKDDPWKTYINDLDVLQKPRVTYALKCGLEAGLAHLTIEQLFRCERKRLISYGVSPDALMFLYLFDNDSFVERFLRSSSISSW